MKCSKTLRGQGPEEGRSEGWGWGLGGSGLSQLPSGGWVSIKASGKARAGAHEKQLGFECGKMKLFFDVHTVGESRSCSRAWKRLPPARSLPSIRVL